MTDTARQCSHEGAWRKRGDTLQCAQCGTCWSYVALVDAERAARMDRAAAERALEEARQAGAREALEVVWRDLQGLTLGRPMNDTAAARQTGHQDAIACVDEHRQRFGAKP